MSSWTPHDISVILHHHCGRGEWQYGMTNAYKASLERLWAVGLIDRKDEDADVTEKGKAFIALVLSTPVPVAKFVDPRFER